MKKVSSLLRAAVPSAGKLGRRERHRAETRERLFRAALRLFAERGFTATTLEDITEAADVGKGTFFNYFPSKEHILATFGEMQVAKIHRALLEAKGNKAPMQRILRRLAHALADEPGRSPAMFRSIVVACFASEPVRLALQRNMEYARRALAELMLLGQQEGEIRRDRKPIVLARVFQQAFFGTLMIWSLDPLSPLSRRFDATFSVFWPGVQARPTHPGGRNRLPRRGEN